MLIFLAFKNGLKMGIFTLWNWPESKWGNPGRVEFIRRFIVIQWKYYFLFSRQICESTTPLHPVLPALIEVFVNSALVPASNRASPDGQTVNEPISEHEIRVVFQNPVFDLPCKTSGQTPIRGHRSRESTPFKSKRVFFSLPWRKFQKMGTTSTKTWTYHFSIKWQNFL